MVFPALLFQVFFYSINFAFTWRGCRRRFWRRLIFCFFSWPVAVCLTSAATFSFSESLLPTFGSADVLDSVLIFSWPSALLCAWPVEEILDSVVACVLTLPETFESTRAAWSCVFCVILPVAPPEIFCATVAVPPPLTVPETVCDIFADAVPPVVPETEALSLPVTVPPV